MNATLFEVLAVLGEGPTDASGLLDRLRSLDDPGAAPSIPALYRHLRRAIERDWVRTQDAEEVDGGPGRPSREYRLTRSGAHAVREEALRLRRFTGMVLDEGAPEGEAP